ncbi:uncharacterized protein LOC131671013 [Phymastichus coffea]|uniref:uncharacterized protein LOC131671013 n=1 Tax=Phymastichus coffea TaxID=108790 RepID=UPI00273ACC65|nr:uncharacterized protein LOC131671013 [Phymastichus coffea]
MRTNPRLSLACSLLLLLVFGGAAQAIFFQGPKKAIWSLLESLGGHKKPPTPVHHYHMHYYPVPIPLPKPALHHAPKIEIDLSSLHSHEPPRSYNWPSHQEPEFVLPPETSVASWAPPLHPEAWPDNSFQQKSSWTWDNNELLEKDPGISEAKSGLLLQVPLHQQIVLYQPPAKDKASLLQILFKKIRRINDAIFHPEEEEYGDGAREAQPHIHNSLTYAPAPN